MSDERPALIVCAHGTDDPAGRQVVLDVCRSVANAHPDLQVHDAYVDVQQPKVGDVVDELAAAGVDVTVVPVLLSSGYHTEKDIDGAVDRHRGARSVVVRSTGALGPHELLAAVLVSRLQEAGARPSDSAVLAVAGSTRASGGADARRMMALLQQVWPGPVSIGFCSATTPSVPDAVAAARQAGAKRVVVASYLLGPGFFHRMLQKAGADLVTQPLGADPRVVRLVGERYARRSDRGPVAG